MKSKYFQEDGGQYHLIHHMSFDTHLVSSCLTDIRQPRLKVLIRYLGTLKAASEQDLMIYVQNAL